MNKFDCIASDGKLIAFNNDDLAKINQIIDKTISDSLSGNDVNALIASAIVSENHCIVFDDDTSVFDDAVNI